MLRRSAVRHPSVPKREVQLVRSTRRATNSPARGSGPVPEEPRRLVDRAGSAWTRRERSRLRRTRRRERSPNFERGIGSTDATSWAAAGWSKVPVRSPWDLARSRTRSRRFQERSGRVRGSRRAPRLVTVSLRGRPPLRTSAPRRAPPMRWAGIPAPLRSRRRRVRRFSIGVLTPSWAGRTPDEIPSRTGPCRSRACGPGPATRSPTRPLRVPPLGSLQFEGAGQQGSEPASTAWATRTSSSTFPRKN